MRKKLKIVLLSLLQCSIFLLPTAHLFAQNTPKNIEKNPLERPARPTAAVEALGLMPLQSGGRIKPLDTFAREGMKLLHGKESLGGRSPVELILTMLLLPDFWQKHPFISVTHRALKEDLGFPTDKKTFSITELTTSPSFFPLIQTLEQKEDKSEKLDAYFQGVARIRDQVSFFQQITSGDAFRLFPPPKGSPREAPWNGLKSLKGDANIRFWLIIATFENKDPLVQARTLEKIKDFTAIVSKVNPDVYPPHWKMAIEVHYNHFRPFRWSWVVGLLAMIFLSFLVVSQKKIYSYLGNTTLALTFLLMLYGFILRVLIAGRPPVSNMYESVVWVAFGCLLFGSILQFIYKKPLISICALGFSVLCLLLADTFTTILDESIHPLEPVLRSNFWLLIHVLTITLGYAAFALSLAISNIAIAPIVFFGRTPSKQSLKEMAHYAYRSVQVGVVLLGAGTILGGVWADYSWGRFWGWDPKETWALIAFLGYVALVHARFRGMVGDFGFLCWCILAFLLVLMAWYGVNFVLGAGLHSYGFSSGGNPGVFLYSAVQVIFVAYSALLFRRRSSAV